MTYHAKPSTQIDLISAYIPYLFSDNAYTCSGLPQYSNYLYTANIHISYIYLAGCNIFVD